MKKNILFPVFLLLVLHITGCKKDKDCKPNPVANEASQIQAYAAANNIAAIPHASGLYYEIIDPGSGMAASVTSKISITYTGKLLNGHIFDQQTTPNNTTSKPAWLLTDLIRGWQIGIPLIKEGGHIRLIIPSALAYGCAPYYDIPGNSPLYFDVHLVDVQ